MAPAKQKARVKRVFLTFMVVLFLEDPGLEPANRGGILARAARFWQPNDQPARFSDSPASRPLYEPHRLTAIPSSAIIAALVASAEAALAASGAYTTWMWFDRWRPMN